MNKICTSNPGGKNNWSRFVEVGSLRSRQCINGLFFKLHLRLCLETQGREYLLQNRYES